MKTVLIAALISAILTPCALAQDQGLEPIGFIGVSYEWAELETPVGDADIDGFSVSGSTAFETPRLRRFFGEGAGAQLDAAYVAGEDDEDAVFGVAHLFSRGEQWLWGGYVALADIEDVGAWGVGAELNRYLDRFTIAGAAGWTWVDDLDTDIFSLTAEARAFLNDNTRIEAGLGWADIDVEDRAADDAISLSLGGERKFGATPFSVFAAYTTTVFDDDVDSNRFSAGLRLNFAPTLIARDRRGPSLSQAPLATRLLF